MTSRFSTRTAIAGLGITSMVLLTTGLNGALAEEQNTIQVRSGEAVEIAVGSASPDTQFSWILTRDRKFVSGQRTRFFQTRLTEAGTYTLDVSVQDTKSGENALRTFVLIVREGTPEQLPEEKDLTSMPLRASAVTEPVSINGIVYLPPNGGILKIDPSKSEGKIEGYSIDLDTGTDTDRDGDAGNDRDNIGTISEKAGTAVYFFALPRPTPRSVRVTVKDLSGTTPSSIDLPLSFSSNPTIPSSALPPVQNVNGPIRIEQADLTVSLQLNATDPALEGKALLYEWDFGDRSRSLLDSPSHTYVAAGTYVVSLTIRDITTAQVLQSISATVQVSEPTNGGSSSVASASSSSSSSSSEKGTSSSFSVWSVMKVLLIIIVLLAIAIGLCVLLTWIKRRTTTSIQQTLEKMEDTIVKKDPKETVSEAVAPMNLKKDVIDITVKKDPEAVVDREKARPDFRTEKRSNETPVASAGPVPPWLKNTSATTEKPPTSPVPATITTPATPATPTPSPKAAVSPPVPVAKPSTPATTPAPAPTTPKPSVPAVPPSVPFPKPVAPTPPPVAQPPVAPVIQETKAPSPAPSGVPATKAIPSAAPQASTTVPTTPKPVQTPPIAPKIATSESPSQVPVRSATAPAPAPISSAAPTPVPKEVSKVVSEAKPIPRVEPKPVKKDESDPPIAIIQADSLTK